MNRPNILVLMSTYNGEQFIREQIDSILNQENVNVELLIRDDGSKDSTKLILQEYEANINCHVIYGENIGANKSFLWLLKNCGECNYYAFSDQDDVWLKDKLITAVNTLTLNHADLYHGLAGRVTKDLQPLPNSSFIPKDSFGASLMQSATGCTMVFTNRLLLQIRTYIPENISMHDAWIYRVSYALGAKVYYDTNSHMLYRQHEHNVSGGQMSFGDKLKKIRKNKGLKYHIAEEIKHGFSNQMTEDDLNTLIQFINYRKSIIGKIRILSSSKYNVNSSKTNMINKILFILNLI